MRSFLPSVVLVSAAFLLGCQDMGSGPVGPEGLVPEFDKPTCGGQHCNHGDDPVDPDPGSLFNSPGVIGTGFTCAGGAEITGGATFGNVNFNQPRGDSHMHANVQLRGAPEGKYDIFGNQELVCDLDPNDVLNKKVDFLLRPGHATTVTVGANGKGKARIGLDFGGPEPSLGGAAAHAAGSHRLWLTLVGTSGAADGVVLRSTAIEVVIPVHEGQ